MKLWLTRLVFTALAIIVIAAMIWGSGWPYVPGVVRTYPVGNGISDWMNHCHKFMAVWPVSAFTLPREGQPFIYIDPCCNPSGMPCL